MTPTTYGRLEKGGHTRTERLQAIADAFFLPLVEVLLMMPEHPEAAPADPLNAIQELRAQVAQLRREIATMRAERQPATTVAEAERRAHSADAAALRLMDQADAMAQRKTTRATNKGQKKRRHTRK